jgi:soluble lytic murein transglycosylase-like protein
LSLSLSLSFSEAQTSKWEKRHQFKWDRQLLSFVVESYSDSEKVFYRLAQVYSESAFNPLATSDFGNWKLAGLDTSTAIFQKKGAAGLTQFIWPTAKFYGATSVSTKQAFCDTISTDIYNPLWSLRSCCRYMRSNEILMMRTKNPRAKKRLVIDKDFLELCSTAGYNTGPGKILKQLNKDSRWSVIRLKILEEPRLYSEKIIKTAKEMKESKRWTLKKW